MGKNHQSRNSIGPKKGVFQITGNHVQVTILLKGEETALTQILGHALKSSIGVRRIVERALTFCHSKKGGKGKSLTNL